MSKPRYRYIGKQGGKLHIATDKSGYGIPLCERRSTSGWHVLGNVGRENLTAQSVANKVCKKCANHWWAEQEQPHHE